MVELHLVPPLSPGSLSLSVGTPGTRHRPQRPRGVWVGNERTGRCRYLAEATCMPASCPIGCCHPHHTQAAAGATAHMPCPWTTGPVLPPPSYHFSAGTRGTCLSPAACQLPDRMPSLRAELLCPGHHLSLIQAPSSPVPTASWQEVGKQPGSARPHHSWRLPTPEVGLAWPALLEAPLVAISVRGGVFPSSWVCFRAPDHQWGRPTSKPNCIQDSGRPGRWSRRKAMSAQHPHKPHNGCPCAGRSHGGHHPTSHQSISLTSSQEKQSGRQQKAWLIREFTCALSTSSRFLYLQKETVTSARHQTTFRTVTRYPCSH